MTADAEDMGVTVDLLRRQAANRRSSRWWDRGLWFCGLVIAVLTFSGGLWSLSGTLFGQAVDSTVQSCETEPRGAGRFVYSVTDCEVTTLGINGQPTTIQIEASRRYPEDTTLTLIAFRGTYADASQNSNYVWLLPLGLAVAAATWWMGFPSPVDLAYGKHAATRKRRRGE